MDSYNKDDILDNLCFQEYIESIPIKNKIILALIISGYRQEEAAKILGVSRLFISKTYKKALHEIRNDILL